MSTSESSPPAHAALAGAPRDRLPPALWLAAGVAIGASVWLGIVTTQPAEPDVMGMVNRWLVRAGLPFFCLAFAASSLARLWPSPFTRRLLRERRGLGLAFAMIHLTHAAAVMSTWPGAAENVPPAFVIAFGGTGFALTAAMAATSSDAAQRALGRGWGRLHRTGIWYLMFLYAYTYLGRVLEDAAPWPVFALALMLGLVGLRFGVWWRRRRSAGGAGSVAAARS